MDGYYVGECVRDYIINRKIKDIDLVTEHSFLADLLSKKANDAINLIIKLGLLEYKNNSEKLIGLDFMPKKLILRYGYLKNKTGFSKQQVEIGHFSQNNCATIEWLNKKMAKFIKLGAWTKDFFNREAYGIHIKLLNTSRNEQIFLGNGIYFIN